MKEKKSEMKNWEKKEKKSSKTVFQKMLPEKNIGLIHANIVNISMIVEAATESGFQYWFQTIYLLPSIILTFHNVGGNWTELFNWRVFYFPLLWASAVLPGHFSILGWYHKIMITKMKINPTFSETETKKFTTPYKVESLKILSKSKIFDP